MLPMPVLNTYSQCPRKSETSKMNFRLTTFLILFLACSSPLAAQDTPLFPYRAVPQTEPEFPLSKAMARVYDGNYKGVDCFRNELFTNFKYTPLKGFDYHGGDGTVSRRDSTKVIRANAKYYVWYTHQETPTPPNYDGGATETVPSRDWDLAEIWYATSDAGFTWEEQGVAVKKMEKPLAGWCSVSTPDILFWKGKYYLYYQAYLFMPRSRASSGTNDDDCPVSVSWADSPDGPWNTKSTRISSSLRSRSCLPALVRFTWYLSMAREKKQPRKLAGGCSPIA